MVRLFFGQKLLSLTRSGLGLGSVMLPYFNMLSPGMLVLVSLLA
jgi:hypothetical protein